MVGAAADDILDREIAAVAVIEVNPAALIPVSGDEIEIAVVVGVAPFDAPAFVRSGDSPARGEMTESIIGVKLVVARFPLG